MRESLKMVCVVVLGAGALTAALAWFTDRPDGLTWLLRIAGPLAVAAALLGFLRLNFTTDEVPDYLYQEVGDYFDSGGLCYAFVPRHQRGACFLETFFQNRYERPCTVRFSFRPIKRRRGPDVQGFEYEFRCDSAAFGIFRMPVHFPSESQGTQQKFAFGVTVDYPEGKGRMLRFRDGLVVRRDADFNDVLRTMEEFHRLLSPIMLLFPVRDSATMTFDVPADAGIGGSKGPRPRVATIWRLGDAPLA